jgi:hypothetical protein
VSLVDVLPTVCKALGLPSVGVAIDGTSLLSMMRHGVEDAAEPCRAAYTQVLRYQGQRNASYPHGTSAAIGYTVRTARYRHTRWETVPDVEKVMARNRSDPYFHHVADNSVGIGTLLEDELYDHGGSFVSARSAATAEARNLLPLVGLCSPPCADGRAREVLAALAAALRDRPLYVQSHLCAARHVVPLEERIAHA